LGIGGNLKRQFFLFWQPLIEF